MFIDDASMSSFALHNRRLAKNGDHRTRSIALFAQCDPVFPWRFGRNLIKVNLHFMARFTLCIWQYISLDFYTNDCG